MILEFKILIQNSLLIAARTKLRWHQKGLHNKRMLDIFKNGINEYFVHIFVNVFDVFFTYFRNILKKKN